jgi:transcription antitermination protein NusB
MGSRRKAREAAVQMLYQLDICGLEAEAAAVTKLYWEHLGVAGERDPFADELVEGCSKVQDQLDAKIRSVSKHWRLERMSRVDRNIIRLATYELMFQSDIPRRVTLNEAVELAKRFGNEESPAFVNGVLDRIADELNKA